MLIKDFENIVLGGYSVEQSINGNLAVAAPSAGSYATCRKGELIKDQTNDDWYICTVADTTWVKLNA